MFITKKNILLKLSQVIELLENCSFKTYERDEFLFNKAIIELKMLEISIKKSSEEFFDEILADIIFRLNEELQTANQIEKIDFLEEAKNILNYKIQHVPIEISAERLKYEEINWVKTEKICFRGDNREPSIVFVEGFLPQKRSEYIVSQAFNTESGVVRLSSRFLSAACFPFKPEIDKTWVYILKINEFYDVAAHGYLSLINGGMNKELMSEVEASQLFAQEIITNKIPGENIVAAIKIDRSANIEYVENDPLDFYKKRGTYNLIDCEFNPKCLLNDQDKKIILDFIINEFETNTSHKNLPKPSSGYTKNNYSNKNSLFFEMPGSNVSSLNIDDSSEKLTIKNDLSFS